MLYLFNNYQNIISFYLLLMLLLDLEIIVFLMKFCLIIVLFIRNGQFRDEYDLSNL